MQLFVLGPHDSATSSVACLLNSCGFYIGEPQRQRSLGSDKTTEHWEKVGLATLNDDLLWFFGAPWYSAAPLDLNTLPAFLYEWLHRRATTWAADMAQHGPWVGYDPCLSLTAGFWLHVLPDTLLVLCVRHPREVVASLMQRQPCPFARPEEALEAWRRAFLAMVQATRDRQHYVMAYGRLLSDPKGAMTDLLVFCQRQVPSYVPPAEVPEHLESLVAASLDREPAESLANTACAAHDVAAYEALLAGDQARLAAALQAFPASSLVFDTDRLVQGHQHAWTEAQQQLRNLETRLAVTQAHLADKERLLTHVEAQQHHLTLLQQLTENEVQALKRSWSYRVGWMLVRPGAWLKRAYRFFQRLPLLPVTFQASAVSSCQPTETLEELQAKYASLTSRPLFSVLIPVYNTPAPVLRETLESVCNQVYQEWEICLADDGSTRQETLDVVEEFLRREPQRLKCEHLPGNSGIAAASNAAARLATGTFLALLDHDDLLTPQALLEMALRLEQVPEADMLYSDEDKVTMRGDFVQPFYKPDFSPELLLTHNYLCHFSVIRAAVFWDVGGFHTGVDGSQDFDLFLRVTEVAKRVEHVPKILYHWRMVPGSTAADNTAKGGPWHESSRQTLRAAIARRHWQAEVRDGLLPDTYRVKFAVDPTIPVTIIIPTKDKVKLLQACIESIRHYTTHLRYDILVISNNSEEQETYAYLERAKRDGILRFLRHDIPFNYAAINNFAVRHCETPYLLFLNNDTEVTNAEWLTSMLELAQHRDIGAVGAKLLYTDGTIQHAGVILGIGGIAGHSHRYLAEYSAGYFGQHNLMRNYSAVTAACLLTRRDVFETVGGFNEDLAVAFNDVDFCLKIRKAGYRIVYTPYARLYHYESASRGSDNIPETIGRFHAECAYMLAKWGPWLQNDPYYNPNLTPCREDFSLKTPADMATIQAFWRAFPHREQAVRES